MVDEVSKAHAPYVQNFSDIKNTVEIISGKQAKGYQRSDSLSRKV